MKYFNWIYDAVIVILVILLYLRFNSADSPSLQSMFSDPLCIILIIAVAALIIIQAVYSNRKNK